MGRCWDTPMTLALGMVAPIGTMLKWDTSMSSSGVRGRKGWCLGLSRSLSLSCFLWMSLSLSRSLSQSLAGPRLSTEAGVTGELTVEEEEEGGAVAG